MYTIVGLLTQYDVWPRKFHKSNQGRFKCGQQDMVSESTDVRDYGKGPIDAFPSEICGSCWRIPRMVVWANE